MKYCSNKQLFIRIIDILIVFLLVLTVFNNRITADEKVYDNGGGKHNGEIAVDLKGKSEGYSTIIFNNLNGLPTSEANDIVQTSDGFIWIGSYGGLIRYDGNTFETLKIS